MAEYVDKGILLKKIEELEELARDRYLDTPFDSPARTRYQAQLTERTSLKHLIFDLPVANVAPVRHGRWKYYRKQGIAVCTWCSFERKLDDNLGRAVSCPNCGANMDGDTND